jgi:hypothetical protein
MRQLVLLVLVTVSACGSKGDSSKSGPNGHGGSKEATAFSLGTVMGNMGAEARLGHADKASALLGDATAAAADLGIDKPHVPASGEDEDESISFALMQKYDKKITATFALGYELAYSSSYYMASAQPELVDLARIGELAAASAVPDKVWHPHTTKLASSKTDAELGAFAKDVSAYLNQ